ncbi:MAG: hypothetical protein SFW36_07310 [Leptolyngbyaceae cyanobacterium bins.59]|nr:hypothetical protein [Leptolyngbyaceae cyanobacterium bins.59]
MSKIFMSKACQVSQSTYSIESHSIESHSHRLEGKSDNKTSDNGSGGSVVRVESGAIHWGGLMDLPQAQIGYGQKGDIGLILWSGANPKLNGNISCRDIPEPRSFTSGSFAL